MLPAFINMNWGTALLGKLNPYLDNFPAIKRCSCQFQKYVSEMYEWLYSFAFRDSEILEEIEVQILKSVSSDMC